jgi:hypothetical protein
MRLFELSEDMRTVPLSTLVRGILGLKTRIELANAVSDREWGFLKQLCMDELLHSQLARAMSKLNPKTASADLHDNFTSAAAEYAEALNFLAQIGEIARAELVTAETAQSSAQIP